MKKDLINQRKKLVINVGFIALLLLVGSLSAKSKGLDSLRGGTSSVELLNRAITHNTLKARTTASKYITDRVKYFEGDNDTKQELEQALEILKNQTQKELYLVITKGPDLVIRDGERSTIPLEANANNDETFRQSLLDENSVLVTMYFNLVTEYTDEGIQVRNEFALDVEAGNNVSTVLGKVSEVKTRSNAFTNKRDFTRAIVYSFHQLISRGSEGNNLLNTREKLDEYATGLGLVVKGLIVIAPSPLNEVPHQTDVPQQTSAFTLSGIAIETTNYKNLRFHLKTGALTGFTYQPDGASEAIKYTALSATTDGIIKDKFMGYYPKDAYDKIKQGMIDQDADFGAMKDITEKQLDPNKWAALSVGKPGSIVKVIKRKSVGFEGNAEGQEYRKYYGCVSKYTWELKNTEIKTLDVQKTGIGFVTGEIEIAEGVQPEEDERCEINDLVNEETSLQKGWGVLIYAHKIQAVKDNQEERTALIEYANKVSTFLQPDHVALVDFKGSSYTFTKSKIIEILRDLDGPGFEAKYPKEFEARNANDEGKLTQYKVRAAYDPWSTERPTAFSYAHPITSDYNTKSEDYTQNATNYQYSVQDLVDRNKFLALGSPIAEGIMDAEGANKATPISVKDNHTQYVAKWGTESAWLAWSDYTTQVVGTVQQGVMLGLAAISKVMIDGIGIVKIPETWWNPEAGKNGCKPDTITYNPIIKEAFELISDEIERKKQQKAFAFFAGLYNAMIDEITDKLSLANLAAQYYGNPKFAKKMSEAVDKMLQDGVWKLVETEFKKMTCSDFKISYAVGFNLVSMLNIAQGLKAIVQGLSVLGKNALKIAMKARRVIQDFNAQLSSLSIKVKAEVVQKAQDVYEIVSTTLSGNNRKVIAEIDGNGVKVKNWIDVPEDKVIPTNKISREGEVELYVAHKGDEAGVCLKDGSCFVAGTPIFTAHKTFQPIEKIVAGQKVYAENPANCEVATKPVEVTFARTTRQLIRLGFANEIIYATPDHPFFKLNKQQVLAGNLRQGDTLKTYDSYAIVQQALLKDTTATVYNFHVKDFMTYYVGKTKFLVHNMASHFNFSKAISDKIDELKLSPDEVGKLADDLKNINNTKFKNAIDENADLLEGWKVLSSDSKLRVDKPSLEKINATLRGKPNLKAPSGADLQKIYSEEITGDVLVENIELYKRAFDDIIKDENKIKFINNQIDVATPDGHYVPDFDVFNKYKDKFKNDKGEYEAKEFTFKVWNRNKNEMEPIKIKLTYDELGIGYSGVYHPKTGRIAFKITVDLRESVIGKIRKVRPDLSLRRVNDDILSNSENAAKGLEIDGIDHVFDRQESHIRSAALLLNTNTDNVSDILWGFAINPKKGTSGEFEIGFLSGNLHGSRGLGLKSDYYKDKYKYPDRSTSGQLNRCEGVLNRTSQKQLIDMMNKNSQISMDNMWLKEIGDRELTGKGHESVKRSGEGFYW